MVDCLAQRKRRPRILFVCFADSTHSQAWLDLLKDSEFDVRVFTTQEDFSGLYPHQPWSFPTYVLVRPSARHDTGRVMWLIPAPHALHLPAYFAASRFPLGQRWLRWIVSTWHPEIVHSLSLYPCSWFTWQALQRIPASKRPHWVTSSWGSDLAYWGDDTYIRKCTDHVLLHCTGFIADCRRDIRLALDAGLAPSKVALKDPVPGTGGLDLDQFMAAQSDLENRNLIIVPKAFEGRFNKTLPIVEALRLTEDILSGYEIHLFMCTNEVEMWIRTMPESLQRRCHCHKMLPHDQFTSMLQRARVVVAPSLSDGTPNVMLEAMAAGALPLMSPIESIQEWIEDGHNGLLAPALFPDRIATALRRALTDDQLWSTARQVNWQMVNERANRLHVRDQVLDYYRGLLRT